MKSALLVILVSTLFSTSPSSNADCQYGKCVAIAKSTGQQCKNCAQKGSAYCGVHK